MPFCLYAILHQFVAVVFMFTNLFRVAFSLSKLDALTRTNLELTVVAAWRVLKVQNKDFTPTPTPQLNLLHLIK